MASGNDEGSAASAVPRPRADSIFDPDLQNEAELQRGGGLATGVREEERARAMLGISEKSALAWTGPAESQRPGQTELIITIDAVVADRQVRPIVFAQASGAIE
jgi:hypothetical protein